MLHKLLMFVLCAVISVSVVGCSPPPAAGSREAIKQAKELKTLEAQTKYLIRQADLFMKKHECGHAMHIAKYILNNLDENSAAAKRIVMASEEEQARMARKAAEDVEREHSVFVVNRE